MIPPLEMVIGSVMDGLHPRYAVLNLLELWGRKKAPLAPSTEPYEKEAQKKRQGWGMPQGKRPKILVSKDKKALKPTFKTKMAFKNFKNRSA